MGIKTLLVILASLSFSVNAFADDHEGGLPFKISGDFAASYNNFDSGNNPGTAGGIQDGSLLHDDFSINLTEINIEREWSSSRAVMSIVYGSIANAYNTPTVLSVNTLNLANAFYELNSSYGLTFRFGKFESPVGHESYNPRENSNFNRSWGFLLAPFFSTGAHVSYAADMWSVGFIASNGSGTDIDRRDNNKTMALVVDVDPMENFHIDLNYVTGTENDSTNNNSISILDISLAYMINDMFDVALNYIDHGQNPNVTGQDELKASSLAAYVNANFGMYGLGLRYEQFNFDYGITGYNGLNSAGAIGTANTVNPDNTITAITITAKAEIDQNVQVVLEHVMNSADDNGTFVDSDNAATDAFSQTTLGLMYSY